MHMIPELNVSLGPQIGRLKENIIYPTYNLVNELRETSPDALGAQYDHHKLHGILTQVSIWFTYF